jgi:UDP-perosamine 4-acetyltransferase
MICNKPQSSGEDQPVIILGGGGHAKVLIATLLMLGRSIIGFVDPAASKKSIFGVKCLGDDSVVLHHKARNIRLVNGVGSIGSNSSRCDLFNRFKEHGFSFGTVVHPTAIIALDVRLGEGAQIMAGVVIQPGGRVGANAIVNTGAVIDHDCNVGAHVHIAPGAALSGNVRIAIGAHIGTGATIIQSTRIGAWSLVGAGAVVIRNVPARAAFVGVPAKPLTK